MLIYVKLVFIRLNLGISNARYSSILVQVIDNWPFCWCHLATPTLSTGACCNYVRQAFSNMAANKHYRRADLHVIPSDFSLHFHKDKDISLKAKQQGFRFFSEGIFFKRANLYY